MKYGFLFFFLSTIFSLSAQQKIRGILKCATSGQPIPDVYIMLRTEDGKRILAYSYSQPDGSFILECPPDPQQEFLLTTSRLGYEPYRQKIPAQTQQTEILLKESSLTLREVKVISSPIRRQGDTISYYMSNFHRPQDRNLADVLARMPGIHVQSDGRVQYDGKPINRFYIEDMNLLGERYSLATKNLSPSDIAAVQVYENHEPIKMLRDRSQTEQAALNIKLKESARAKWLKTFDFGVGGFPFLYNATGTLARFARKNQTLMIGKINNTGKDIAMELKMHTLKAGQVFRPGAPDGIPDRFSPLSVSSSFFTRDRARFNESSIVSANQLWSIAKDVDLRLNMHYGFEREKRSRTMAIEYRFEDRPPTIINDHTAQTINWHKLECEWMFTANQTRYFLEEKLSTAVHWKEASADIFSSPYTLRQKIHLPRVHLKNNTSILRLLGNVSAGIENESEYTHLPQKLMLSSSDSLPLFRSSHVGQSCRFNEGFSNTHITLNYKKHHQSFGLKCGIAWTWQKIESDLSPWPLVTDTFVNDLTWHTSRLYVEPSYRMNYRNWTISSSASANHLRTNYSGKEATYTYIHPRLRLMFAPSGDFKFNAGYSYTTHYGDLNEMGTGYVLERYNLFSKGIEALQFNASQNINFGVFYKNISHFLQMSYLTIYSLYKDNLIPASFVRDIYTFSWWEQKDRLSSFWLNTLSASKLFMEISLTASINLSYNQSKSVVEQQGSSINYTQHSFGVEPSLKWKAKRNLNFDYTMNAFFSGISMNHRPIDSYIPLINHRLYTYFGVTDRLFFTCNLQHFYSKAPYTSTSNLLFADLGIQYEFQHLTLSLDWSNIFNRKLHVISGYNTINTVTQTDKLRPSEVLISLRFKH